MLLNEVLEKEVIKKPDHLFSEFEGKKITYNEANVIANNLAHALLEEGLKKGDRFSFLSKNCPEMAIMYYAASKVGLVPVPLNYRLADKEWEYIINDSESKLIIVRKSEYVDRINNISSELKDIKKFISIDADDNHQNWEDFYSWIGNYDGSKPDIEVNDDDDVYQMYTCLLYTSPSPRDR